MEHSDAISDEEYIEAVLRELDGARINYDGLMLTSVANKHTWPASQRLEFDRRCLAASNRLAAARDAYQRLVSDKLVDGGR